MFNSNPSDGSKVVLVEERMTVRSRLGDLAKVTAPNSEPSILSTRFSGESNSVLLLGSASLNSRSRSGDRSLAFESA